MLEIEESIKVTSKTTKEELRKSVRKILERNADLQQSNEELRARNKSLQEENNTLHGHIKNLWNIINRAIDLKEMIDDVEDASEELKKACDALYGKQGNEEED